jgi:hypothetical protein
MFESNFVAVLEHFTAEGKRELAYDLNGKGE